MARVGRRNHVVRAKATALLVVILTAVVAFFSSCGNSATSESTPSSLASTSSSASASSGTASDVATRVAAKCNVFAASSLSKAFPEIEKALRQADPSLASVEFVYNFQGTDTLVQQIKEGAPADVFASASLKYGRELLEAGLIGEPVNFCQNRLIVIIPKANPGEIGALEDLTKPGKKIAIGAESVPVGAYTRTVLENIDKAMAAGFSAKIMENVVTQEMKVTAITSSVSLGEVDAGFVYVTDAAAAEDNVTHVDIPDLYQSDPLPTYPIAVVKTNESGAVAQKFIDFVLSPDGQAILQQFGFLPKP